MKILNNLTVIVIFVTFPLTTYAQQEPPTLPKLWIKKPIRPKINAHLSGDIFYFPDKKWQFINNDIHHLIGKEFDNQNAKDTLTSVELQTRQIYQDNNYLTIAMDYQISDLTSRYFTEYYTLDLPYHRLLTLSEYLNRKHIRYATVQTAIKRYLQPCVDVEKQNNQPPLPEQCEDIPISHLIGLQKSVDKGFDIPNNRQFFIVGKDKLGVAFNSYKFTTSFIYDEKTKEVALLKF